MGYTFKTISIQNFKYITNDEPLQIDFDNFDIVILKGQNGYGKTTLFDAIEILLTGGIKHFNANLQNRKIETLGTLANDETKDIIVSAVLSDETKRKISIERRLLCSNNFQDILLFNGQVIKQDYLYDKLKYNLNFFNIGIYLSQSKSLDFLQSRYKDRKTYVSSILDNTEIDEKIAKLKNIQKELEKRCEKEKEVQKQKILKTEFTVQRLSEQIKNTEINSELSIENTRLFNDVDYPFDTLNIDTNITYDTLISTLEQLKDFIENYKEYEIYLSNVDIKELLYIPKQVYMALFYSEYIKLLNNNEEIINSIHTIKDLLDDFSKNIWSVNEELFKRVGVSNYCIKSIKDLKSKQQIKRNSLANADKILFQMSKARDVFIRQFNEAVSTGTISNNKCPLCGTNIDSMDTAIKETETFIRDIRTDGTMVLESIETEIEYFFKEVIFCLKSYLEDNKLFIKLENTLSACRYLSIDRLQTLLNKIGFSDFFSCNEDSFNISEFEQKYNTITEIIKSKEIPNNIILEDKKINLYKTIHSKYYHNQKPYHSLEQLCNKERYITKLFNDKFSKQLLSVNNELVELKKNYEDYVSKESLMMESVKLLISKYESANKDYQTQITSAIKLPLLIYSGRIIQNYSLGLGIRAVINTNQLVFEATDKDGTDVYNILSTGQLNSLSIAFLLAIKNVYGQSDGLDVLLIDDPLQTIDSSSITSLVNLLIQQKIGQIILSTHEDNKADLLGDMFSNMNSNVFKQDMQKLYMSNR